MKTIVFLVLIGLIAGAAAGDVYTWKDEKGRTVVSDQPPPASVKSFDQRKSSANVIQTSEASYSAQQAAKNFPVTLYATDCGEFCNSARAHLAKRGIPYVEKNPMKADEVENFRKLTGGGMEVPFLLVGQLKTIKGYQAPEWDAALDQAGYPSAAIPGAKPAPKPPAAK
ncbi:MAG TPA: glutaredoxin family protein [Burkholderiales bacterium]|jgi:hypothetical protein|nr:glutaredoxin family protein [Burkholderiales bacterium]